MQNIDIKQAESELSVIKQIMLDSRKIVIDNGKQLIFWGLLVTSALIVNYLMILNRMNYKYIGYLWLILMTAGFIFSLLWERSDIKKLRVKTFAGTLLGTLWFGSAIAMFIFGFVGPYSKAYNPVFICPIISTVLGISYFTSGAIQQIRWLQLLAAFWWLGAIYMFFFPSVHVLIIFAGMMFFLQATPGFILYRKWKNENENVAV